MDPKNEILENDFEFGNPNLCIKCEKELKVGPSYCKNCKASINKKYKSEHKIETKKYNKKYYNNHIL